MNKENKIYLVMYSYYSDWEIYGYFTNRDDADKYCVAHPEQDLYVKEITSYDNLCEDFRNISLKYTHTFVFFKENIEKGISDWSPRYDGYKCYQDEFLKSNVFESCNLPLWIRIKVNSLDNNVEKAEKVSFDLLYQYLNFCNSKPSDKTMAAFNLILNKEERERAEAKQQEWIKQKELEELARLKAKYE